MISGEPNVILGYESQKWKRLFYEILDRKYVYFKKVREKNVHYAFMYLLLQIVGVRALCRFAL